jgi:hypothetical protein
VTGVAGFAGSPSSQLRIVEKGLSLFGIACCKGKGQTQTKDRDGQHHNLSMFHSFHLISSAFLSPHTEEQGFSELPALILPEAGPPRNSCGFLTLMWGPSPFHRVTKGFEI